MIEIISVRENRTLEELFRDMGKALARFEESVEDLEGIMSDFDVYRKDQEDIAYAKWLRNRPVCAYCEEPITEDKALYLDGEWICDECVRDHRKYVEVD